MSDSSNTEARVWQMSDEAIAVHDKCVALIGRPSMGSYGTCTSADLLRHLQLVFGTDRPHQARHVTRNEP